MAHGPVFLHHAQVRCRGCDLLISQPQASSEELKRFYGRLYYEELWNDPAACDTSAEYLKYEWPLMQRLWGGGAPPKGGTAVEIGCGYGEMLCILRDDGFRVRGCDAGERAVAHCIGKGLDVQRAWWPDLPYSAGEADLSLSLQVIEHVPDPRAFTVDQVSLVRHRGVVVIATEDAWTSQCAWERLSRQLRGRVPAFRSPTDHTFVFQARHLRTLLQDAGCEVRTVSYSRVPARESLHWKMYKGLFRTIDRLIGHGDFLMAVAHRA